MDHTYFNTLNTCFNINYIKEAYKKNFLNYIHKLYKLYINIILFIYNKLFNI